MKWLLWLIVLFGIATVLTTLSGSQQGVVQFVFPQLRVELAFTLFVLLLIGFGLLFMLLVRLVRAATSLPRRVRDHREAVRARRAHGELESALRAFFENRWARAERHAAKAIDHPQTGSLARMLASRSAQAQRQYNRAEAYLADASDHPEDRWMAALARADILIQRKRAAEALPILHALRAKTPSHSGALRLELLAQQNTGQWAEVLRLTEQGAKLGVLDPLSLNQHRETATVALLDSLETDLAALQRIWGQTPVETRRAPRVALAAARAFARCGQAGLAGDCLDASLAENWSSDLAALSLELSDRSDTASALQRGETWLTAHPDDVQLLLSLGRLCQSRSLWGKARNYLEAALAVAPGIEAHLALAELLEELGEHEAARPHLRAAAQLAADRISHKV